MADYTSKVLRFEQGDNSYEIIPEVLEFSALNNFPLTGTAGVLYIDKSENITYRWDDINLVYVKIAEPNDAPRVVEADSINVFPPIGSITTLYVDKSTNFLYRWNSSNSAYENITTDLTDFLSKADSMIVIDGDRSDKDTIIGDYVVVKNSVISGISDGFYTATSNVVAGIPFSSGDLTDVAFNNGIFNHLRINTRAMTDANTIARMKFIICPSSANDPVSYIVDALAGDQTTAVIRGSSNLASLVGLSSGAVFGVCTRIGTSSNTTARIDFMLGKQNGQMSIGKIENINNSEAISITYKIINPCPANADSLFMTVIYTKKYKNITISTDGSTLSYKCSDLTADKSVPSGYTPIAIKQMSTGWNNAVIYNCHAGRFYSSNTNTCLNVKLLTDVTTERTITIEILYARSDFVSS